MSNHVGLVVKKRKFQYLVVCGYELELHYPCIILKNSEI